MVVLDLRSIPVEIVVIGMPLEKHVPVEKET